MDKENETNSHMSSLNLLHTALIFHLIGLILLAGSTVLDFFTMLRFWKKYSLNSSDAFVIREVQLVFPAAGRTGTALLVLSGISMMAIMHGAYGQQIWMRIKIGLVVLVILNLLLVRRRNGARLF